MRNSIGLGLLLATLALGTPEVSAQLAEKKVLTLAAAQKMVAAAQAEAQRNHLAGVIAVVDDGGWPILLLRMDNAAYVASVELAPGKARTAALFKKPSQALEDGLSFEGRHESRRNLCDPRRQSARGDTAPDVEPTDRVFR
jgi:glc operon protein GlcG